MENLNSKLNQTREELASKMRELKHRTSDLDIVNQEKLEIKSELEKEKNERSKAEVSLKEAVMQAAILETEVKSWKRKEKRWKEKKQELNRRIIATIDVEGMETSNMQNESLKGLTDSHSHQKSMSKETLSKERNNTESVAGSKGLDKSMLNVDSKSRISEVSSGRASVQPVEETENQDKFE